MLKAPNHKQMRAKVHALAEFESLRHLTFKFVSHFDIRYSNFSFEALFEWGSTYQPYRYPDTTVSYRSRRNVNITKTKHPSLQITRSQISWASRRLNFHLGYGFALIGGSLGCGSSFSFLFGPRQFQFRVGRRYRPIGAPAVRIAPVMQWLTCL